VRNLVRFLEAMLGGIAASIGGAALGVGFGLVLSLVYYVVSLILSFKGHWIPEPRDLEHSIFGSFGFAFIALAACGILGAVLTGFEAFSRILGRRNSHRDFFRR
jgi:hypothetical protein